LNCREFQRRLDEGMPRGAAAAFEAHATGCAACAEELRAASAVEELLSGDLVAVRAPEGFTDRVLQGVRAAGVNRSVFPAWLLGDSFPWWVRAATEPRVVLALVLFSLVVWRADFLRVLAFTVAVEASRWMDAGFARFAPLQDALARPEVVAGVVLALIPLLAMGSAVLYRGAETFFVSRTSPDAPARRG
jgi:hypothetical protein